VTAPSILEGAVEELVRVERPLLLQLGRRLNCVVSEVAFAGRWNTVAQRPYREVMVFTDGLTHADPLPNPIGVVLRPLIGGLDRCLKGDLIKLRVTDGALNIFDAEDHRVRRGTFNPSKPSVVVADHREYREVIAAGDWHHLNPSYAAVIVDFINAHEKASLVHFMVSEQGTTVLAGDPGHDYAQKLIPDITGDVSNSVAVPAKFLRAVLAQREASAIAMAFMTRAGIGIRFATEGQVEVTYLIAPSDESGRSQRLPRLDLLARMDKMFETSGEPELATPEVLKNLAAEGITFPGKQPEQRLRHAVPSEVRSKYVNRASLRGHAYVGADIRWVMGQIPGMSRA
jgi:hypothetical protein